MEPAEHGIVYATALAQCHKRTGEGTINTSRLFDRRAYGGKIADEKRMRSPPSAARSRTRGQRI